MDNSKPILRLKSRMLLKPAYCSVYTSATTSSISGIKVFLLEEALMTEEAQDL